MPNYSLVVNSKFKPMSLQEMLVPFEKYGTAYKEQEDALAKLAADASVWDGMVDAAKDKAAAGQLDKYSNDLVAQRDAIATNGLDVGSRRKMLDLKARYENEVGSIEKAFKAREEARKAQQDAYVKSGGNVRYSQWASADSLDNYLGGKRPEYLMFNLDDVMKESAAGAKAMSERYFSTKEGKAFRSQYLNLIEEKGLTPEQAMQVMNNITRDNQEQYPEFSRFTNDMRTKYKTGNFGEDDQEAFNAAMAQGFNTGITYSKSNKLVQNGEYLNAAERFSQKKQEENLKLARERLELEKGDGGSRILPNGDVATKQGSNWVITDPETGEVKNITNASNLAKEIAKTRRKPEGFKPIDFEYKILSDNITFFTGSRGLLHNNFFSTRDAKPISKDKLTDKARVQLMLKLGDYGLSIDDVDIYEDHDLPSRNAYRVVYKGDDINGNTQEKPAGNNGSKSGGNTSSIGYDGSFAD